MRHQRGEGGDGPQGGNCSSDRFGRKDASRGGCRGIRPEPADVIIDCVGAKPLFQQILDAAAKTSTVVIVGNYSENVELNVAQIQRNELNFLGNITYTRDDFETAIRLFEERKVYVEGFISARFPIEQIQEGMDQAVTGKAHNMKTIFDY